MAHSRHAAMTFRVIAAHMMAMSAILSGGSLPAQAQAPAPIYRPPLLNVPPPAVAPPPGMINGIGSGFGEQPNRNGTVRGAGADGAGVGRNPALHGGNGPGTGMVPKPVGQGE